MNEYARISNPREIIKAEVYLRNRRKGIQWEKQGGGAVPFVITRLNKVKVYVAKWDYLIDDEGCLFPLKPHVFNATYERVHAECG